MDWTNERYVRLYTRDTVTWKLLDWRARTVLLHLLRKLDRSGVLDVGQDGILAAAAIVELPLELVEAGMPQLLARGVVVQTDTAYTMPNFIEAQETKQSDAQRAREFRHRRRDRVLGREPKRVTKRDASVTKRDASVTKRDASSRASRAPSLLPSLPSLPSQSKSTRAGKPAAAALRIAEAACEEINRLSGRKYQPGSKQVEKLAIAIAKAGHTSEQVKRVIAAKAAEWMPNDKMRNQVNPSTLLRLSNFERYLEDLEAGPPRIGETAHRQPAVPAALWDTERATPELEQGSSDGVISW